MLALATATLLGGFTSVLYDAFTAHELTPMQHGAVVVAWLATAATTGVCLIGSAVSGIAAGAIWWEEWLEGPRKDESVL